MKTRKRINLAYSILIDEAVTGSEKTIEEIRLAVNIERRDLLRIRRGQKFPSQKVRENLERELGITPGFKKQRLEEAVDERLRDIFQWYREPANRTHLKGVARKYYSAIPGITDLPMVTRPEWLADKPIPLSVVDKELRKHWKYDEVDPVPRPFAWLGTETFSRFIQRIAPNVQLENRFCYRLLDVNSDGKLFQMSFGPSRYWQFINSCELLSFELAEWCFRKDRDLVGRMPKPKPLELRLRGAPGELFRLNKRSACPACSTFLLILNSRKGDYFLLHERLSVGLLDSPGGWHVVPSGQFQPDGIEDIHHDRDFSIERTVMRELAEELLGVEEAQDVVRTLDDFYNYPRLKPFADGLKNGALRSYFLGIGFDPLPTKPGILTALVIDASRLPTSALDFINNWEGKYVEVWLDQLEDLSRDPKMIPDGATCLILAHKHLKQLLRR